MKILFLDDSDYRTRDFQSSIPSATCVKTAKECIEQLNKSVWDVVFLDHDLGDDEYTKSDIEETGGEVARWMADHKLPDVKFVVLHSMNHIGRSYMEKILSHAGYRVHSAPYNSIPFTACVNGLATQIRWEQNATC